MCFSSLTTLPTSIPISSFNLKNVKPNEWFKREVSCVSQSKVKNFKMQDSSLKTLINSLKTLSKSYAKHIRYPKNLRRVAWIMIRSLNITIFRKKMSGIPTSKTMCFLWVTFGINSILKWGSFHKHLTLLKTIMLIQTWVLMSNNTVQLLSWHTL